MKLTPKERAAERIALILLDFDEQDAEAIANDAVDIAYRIRHARTDPSWGFVLGRPHLNKRLIQLRRKENLA